MHWSGNRVSGRSVRTPDGKVWRIRVTKHDKRINQRGGDIIVWGVPPEAEDHYQFIERPEEWSPAYKQMLADKEWMFYDPLYCKTNKIMALPHFIIRRRVLKAYEKRMGPTEVARRGEKRTLWRRGSVPLAVLTTSTPS